MERCHDFCAAHWGHEPDQRQGFPTGFKATGMPNPWALRILWEDSWRRNSMARCRRSQGRFMERGSQHPVGARLCASVLRLVFDAAAFPRRTEKCRLWALGRLVVPDKAKDEQAADDHKEEGWHG